MLRHLGEGATADRLQAAVAGTYREAKWLTRDVGGTATTKDFTEAVIDHLGS
jgi:isocitrate dehydrogenase (NAD+)